MGISASIAHSSRKYRTREELPHSQRSRHSASGGRDGNEEDTASVSSFRPSSPLAHQDARAFTFNGTHTKPRELRRQDVNRHSYYSNRDFGSYPGHKGSYYGSMERGSWAGSGSRSAYGTPRGVGSRALVSQSSSSFSTPGHTMRDVREYLISNPDLLAGKKSRKVRQPTESELYGLSNSNYKQMKTKQNVYMGLINPPVIYGMGARPNDRDRQLRVDQKLYLNLVYPTIRAKEYHNQAIRSRPPLKHDDMVVVRRDDHLRQPNGYVRRPLPQMHVSRLHEAPLARTYPESIYGDRALSAPLPKGRGRPPTSSKGIPKRGSNDYIDLPHITEEPHTSRSVKSERQVPQFRHMNGHVNHDQPMQKTATQKTARGVNDDDEVVFTFNVDDLELRKKSSKEREQVVPLYFRKSLAYSPKYEYSEDLLSSPL